MIFTTYNSEAVCLLPYEPDWSTSVTVGVRMVTDIEKALTAQESRSAFASSARYQLDWTGLLLSALESTRLKQGLDRLKGEQLLVPMWTDGMELASAVSSGATSLPIAGDLRVRGGSVYVLLDEDALTYELVTVTAVTGAPALTLAAGTALAWPAGARIYPVMFGRFTSRPQVTALNAEMSRPQFSVVEDSPYSRRLLLAAGSSPTVGSTITDLSARPILTIAPDVANQPVEATEEDAELKAIGSQRETQRFDYGQAPRRLLEMSFLSLQRTSIAALESFFIARQGPLDPFCVPTWRGDVDLVADAAAGTSLLVVGANAYSDAAYSARPGQPYLALIDATDAVQPARVNLIDISGLHLQHTLTADVKAASTLISNLLLVRFAQTELQWEYLNGAVAKCRVRMMEVPGEYAVTPAAPPVRAYLYTFTERTPTPIVSRFTSFEAPLTRGGDVYAVGPFEHGEIKEGLTMESQDVEITTWDFAGNPVAKLRPYRLEGRLDVVIEEVDATNPDATSLVLFSGAVTKADPKGKELAAKAIAFANLFARQVPNWAIGPRCNYSIYSRACGVDRSAFGKTGTAYAAVTAAQTIRVAGAALNATTANQYASGYAEITAVDGKFYRRGVLANLAWDGTAHFVECSLHAPVTLVGTETITLYPGCNGSPENCTLFSNYPQGFGGAPYVPDVNPALVAVQQAGPKGGKK